ncbi:hypothetical protein SAMN05216553_12423 [Lentzea fradiae]|uniref:DUF3592 domain-containing protein n=1 Tax=Lentzea fradiae TaxID=200378 RepID=A0A1G8CSB5_9PSEU|nr:hypothetical protein [Lentzea fradiae]SDH48391.1 hypothetical protein SAMN05216553_12423 [Lentzea fradiae]
MRELKPFGLLCAGVVVLVVCWLVAFATLAVLILQPSGALWALLGIPLVAALLLFGFVLAFEFVEELEPSDGGMTANALIAFFFAALAALFVGGTTTYFSGAQIYHAHFGAPAEAVVTYIAPMNNESGGVTGWSYYVDDAATGQDLGRLAAYPATETAEGGRLTVSVDPSGWMRPVPADRLGWTTVPSAILLSCAGVVALGGLVSVATGFGVWLRKRAQRSPSA